MPPRRAAPFSVSPGTNTASAPPPSGGATILGRGAGEELGRVLAVAVQQHDDVEVLLDGPAVAGLLVAAVAEVAGVADHGDGQIGGALLVLETDGEGVVLTVVVTHQHLGDPRPERLGDAVEDVDEGRGRVVRHHEDPDLLRALAYRTTMGSIFAWTDPGGGGQRAAGAGWSAHAPPPPPADHAR